MLLNFCNLFKLSVATAALYLIFEVLPNYVNADDASKNSSDRLKVKVYYETLCPDSIRFINNQLYPSLTNNDRLKHADLEFVPYGKVTKWTNPFTKETTLHCQHGTAECEQNALHACIVENNSDEEQLEMINCLMSSYRSQLDQCAESLNIDVTEAKRCKLSRATPDILKKYGEETDVIKISFVPSIALNEEFNRQEQRQILYNFDETFCSMYQTKFNVPLENC